MPLSDLLHIAIPSKGRAGECPSMEVFPSASIYVPESEAPDYRRHYRNVVPVPTSVRGITPTRNWILDHTDLPWVVMLDDDVLRHGWLEWFSESYEYRDMTPSGWTQEFCRLFEVTEDMGGHIWGVATQSDPMTSYSYRPYIWHTYVTASCMGILNYTGIRFDESFVVKEDYELCLRCLMQDGFVVGARYLYWENEHWETEGGCKDYRTVPLEEDAINRLMEMYPGYIRKITRKASAYTVKLEF